MSCNKQNQRSNQHFNSQNGWRSISTNSITKEYGGMRGFMRSYDLKPHEEGSYAEARSIINEYKKAVWLHIVHYYKREQQQQQKNN